jgi:hypothetical protein
MFLSSKNFNELCMLIDIDNYRFVSSNKLCQVMNDLNNINNLQDLESFYSIYENVFSSLCAFRIQLLITNYKLSSAILVIKFISKIKYRLKKKKLQNTTFIDTTNTTTTNTL